MHAALSLRRDGVAFVTDDKPRLHESQPQLLARGGTYASPLVVRQGTETVIYLKMLVALKAKVAIKSLPSSDGGASSAPAVALDTSGLLSSQFSSKAGSCRAIRLSFVRAGRALLEVRQQGPAAPAGDASVGHPRAG